MRLLTIPGVFRPRSDSWLLAEEVAKRAGSGQEFLDPFSGSGILAIAAAQQGARATALDISRRAVFCIRLNALLNRVRIRTLHASSPSRLGRRFHLIAANPPYVPSPRRTPKGAARAWEAGPDGRRFIDRLCDDAPGLLRPGGRMLLVHSSVCGEDETLERLTERGLEARVIERHRGPLGPLMQAGLETQPDSEELPSTEEMLVFEAVAV